MYEVEVGPSALSNVKSANKFPFIFLIQTGLSWCCLNRMLQEQAHEELEEEDDDDPVFVLTDEWREFFAKSEAKRKLGSSSSLSIFHILGSSSL